MTRTEDINVESFVRTIPTMMMNGMMISIMEILLLMMLPSVSRTAGYPMAPSYKPPQLPMYDGHSDPK
jgi:hypothetical protein